MPPSVMRFVGALAFLCAAAAAAPAGLAASHADGIFPARSIDYIIPFGAGGESDIAAHLQQPAFRRLTGRDLVIKYRPGGGGAVMWNEINSLPRDGHTIVGINLPHIILQPALGAHYRTGDITPIYLFHYTPHAIVVRDDSGFETLADLIVHADNKSGQLRFSGSGRGSANHLAQILFDKLAKINTRYQQYKGTAASITALLQNRVDASWGYTTVGAKYGRDVRLLAVATEKRHPRFPDVPTFRELGYKIVGGAYRGIAVPKSTPIVIRERLSAIFADINKDPAGRSKMQHLGFVPIDVPYGRAKQFVKARAKKYLALAKEAGLTR